MKPSVLQGPQARELRAPSPFNRHETASGRASAVSYPVECDFDRQPWVSGRDEFTVACQADDAFGLSGSRRLALWALLGVALLLLIAPPLTAALSLLDSSALDRTFARFEQVSRIAVLVQLGRFPLFLVLATWLVRSPKEQ